VGGEPFAKAEILRIKEAFDVGAYYDGSGTTAGTCLRHTVDCAALAENIEERC